MIRPLTGLPGWLLCGMMRRAACDSLSRVPRVRFLGQVSLPVAVRARSEPAFSKALRIAWLRGRLLYCNLARGWAQFESSRMVDMQVRHASFCVWCFGALRRVYEGRVATATPRLLLLYHRHLPTPSASPFSFVSICFPGFLYDTLSTFLIVDYFLPSLSTFSSQHAARFSYLLCLSSIFEPSCLLSLLDRREAIHLLPLNATQAQQHQPSPNATSNHDSHPLRNNATLPLHRRRPRRLQHSLAKDQRQRVRPFPPDQKSISH